MRLIDANVAIKNCEKEFDGVCVYDVSQSEVINDFTSIIDMTPTVDAEPVRHGQWMFDNDGGTHCSYCGKSVKDDTEKGKLIPVDLSAMPFCPKCGAKMDLEEKK